MADHYKVLGVTKSATKREIKDAFRKLAVQFHPDKHAQSSKSSRDAATLKFKQVSEAYEVLIDDRKRAAYNMKSPYNNGGNFYSSSYNRNSYNYNGGSYYKGSHWGSSKSNNAGRWVSNLDAALRYMTTRAFLLNATFVGILLGGTVAIDLSRESLWKMYNSGKSFEDAMESIEKNKARKGKQ